MSDNKTSAKTEAQLEADRLADIQIQYDKDKVYKSSQRHEFIVKNLMDTPEDKESFKILNFLSGIIYVENNAVLYAVVFPKKYGLFSPVAVLSNKEMYLVRNNAHIVMENEKDDDGKSLYKKISEVPSEEHYQFFKINKVTYKFNKPVFFDANQSINTVDNDAIHDVLNGKVYTVQIFNDLIEIITSYFFHPNKYEYDVIGAATVVSYITHILGNVFYLVMYGGRGTGKSSLICLNSFLQFKGYFTGKGTIPSSVRLLNFQEIALNQDEFEKMKGDEKMRMVNVFNNGFNIYGKYTITNTNIRDISKQVTGMNTFGMKSFTGNTLSGFDPSFIDRLYVINSIKTNKSLSNIYELNRKDMQRFQSMRNKLFVYCMSNWKQIKGDITEVKKQLEKQKIFGRETDKNSLILGIIQHFKGEDYAKKVENYIQKKAPVQQLEYVLTLEYIILDTIVSQCNKDTTAFVKVSNELLYNSLLASLDINSSDKYAPSNQKPRIILDSLGLTLLAENVGYNDKGNRAFDINVQQLRNILVNDAKYVELLKKLDVKIPTKPSKPTKPTSKNTGEFGELMEFGGQNVSHKNNNSDEKQPSVGQRDRIIKIENYIKEVGGRTNETAFKAFLKSELNVADPDKYLEILIEKSIVTRYSGDNPGIGFTGAGK